MCAIKICQKSSAYFPRFIIFYNTNGEHTNQLQPAQQTDEAPKLFSIPLSPQQMLSAKINLK
jgi:hypothetical protein